LKQTLKPTFVGTSPRLVVRRPTHRTSPKARPSRISGAVRATSAKGIAACAASLQGFRPFAGWRHRFRISPSTTPWLSWLSPSLRRSPSSALSLAVDAALAGLAHPTALELALPPASQPCLVATSQALQERSRPGSYSLCYRVSKSSEVGLPLPRLPPS